MSKKNRIDFATATVPEKIREHARVMFEDVPAGEQFIGARDAILHTVLFEIAAWMEQHSREPKP